MKKNDSQPEIMTVSGLANYLRCHPSTVYRLLKEKKIPAFKVGSDWRFQRSQIDRWIEKKAAW
jgi:excisionase family DNA binding protein